LKMNYRIVGTDTTALSSALQCCDRPFLVKPVTHRHYIRQLLSIVKDNHVKLLIPTVDLDLKVLAQNKKRFAALGCCVLVSSPEVVDICQDKRKTYRFLRSSGFDTPVTMSPRTAISRKGLTWPCFLKPCDGYAGRGNAVVRNRKELVFSSKRIPNCIVQEFVHGSEHTCDVYVDFGMKVRCVVPRKRIEIRGGEVSKAQVIKHRRIMDEAAKLVGKLGAGPGVITLQLFLTDDGGVRFIEVNPRFGGGVPLSIKAGANFPKWILRGLLARDRSDLRPEGPWSSQASGRFDGFEDRLTMLRYDAEVWLEKAEAKEIRNDI